MNISEELVELVGHYNPLHEYPYHVVPIFRCNNNELVATYWSEGTLSTCRLDDQMEMVHHNKDISERLCNYNPEGNALFAFSEDNIVSYPLDNADWFFRGMFQKQELVGANPFLKLSLYIDSGQHEDLFKLTRSCLLELGGNCEDGFAESWYIKERKNLSLELPSDFNSFLCEIDVVKVGCLIGDESLLLSLSRIANDQPINETYIIPEVIDWLPTDSQNAQFGIEAFLREIEFYEQRSNLIPLVSSEVVLAVRKEYFQKRQLKPSWESVLRQAVMDESFRWIRPRGDTASGRLVEWALENIFEKNGMRDSFNIDRRYLVERVYRYAEFDDVAANASIEWDTWNVDAMVVKRHSATHLFGHLSGKNSPILISYDEPLLVDYALEITQLSKLKNKNSYFQKICNSKNLEYMYHKSNVRPAFSMAALNDYECMRKSNNVFKERPVALCLVVDISGSMRGEKLETAKQGIAALLGLLSSDRTDVVGMVSFSSLATPIVPVGYIDEIGECIAGTTRGLSSDGQTALLDAVLIACDQLDNWPDYVPVVVLITDGHENHSKHRLEDVEFYLRSTKNAPTILGLAYGDDADYQLLSHLAKITRGKVFEGTVLNIVQLYNYLARLL